MAVIRFENVGKTYDDGTVAIANVDLEIADGEFLVLVGPSGCGKSTLLRSAAGLEDLTTGRFWLDDKDMTFTDPADRDVAMVFQNYALYPHMTVYSNLAFGLEQRGMPRPEIDRKIHETVRIIGLEDQLRRKPGALSGGQRQRVAMGRAIIRDPAAYLMDEPLSNLDAKLRVQMRAELKLLSRRLGVTTLYVTHDQDEAMTMGDRVAVLRPISDASETNLQQTAAPSDVYAHPCNLFVAGFIGSPAMNFLNARVTAAGSGLAFVVDGIDTRFVVSAQSSARRPGLAAYHDRAVIVGVRPEDFRLVGAGDGSALEVGLLVTETTGPDAFLYCNLASPPVSHTDVAGGTASYQATRDDLQTRLIARVPASEAPTGATVVHLAMTSGTEYFFDPTTGAAIS